jgi:hypothetical protein
MNRLRVDWSLLGSASVPDGIDLTRGIAVVRQAMHGL